MEVHEPFRIDRLIQRRTQRSVALKVGIAPAVLSDFECGYRSLPDEIVDRLRRVLSRSEGTDPSGVRLGGWFERVLVNERDQIPRPLDCGIPISCPLGV